jgi:hypothetical protein
LSVDGRIAWEGGKPEAPFGLAAERSILGMMDKFVVDLRAIGNFAVLSSRFVSIVPTLELPEFPADQVSNGSTDFASDGRGGSANFVVAFLPQADCGGLPRHRNWPLHYEWRTARL